jgi:hypothetical protein
VVAFGALVDVVLGRSSFSLGADAMYFFKIYVLSGELFSELGGQFAAMHERY